MSSKSANLEIVGIFKECIPIFNVLADEERQSIMIILDENEGGINVKDLSEKMTLSRPAVSHHLKVLRKSGIIDFQKRGTENYYFLTLKNSVEELKKLISIIELNCELK